MLQPYAEPGSDTLFAWGCKVPAHLIMTPEDDGRGFKGAAMYIDPWHHEPALTGLLRAWLRSNTSWHMRQDRPEENDTQSAVFWLMPAPTLRQASADEIAADILNDPALGEALGLLATGEGRLIE